MPFSYLVTRRLPLAAVVSCALGCGAVGCSADPRVGQGSHHDATVDARAPDATPEPPPEAGLADRASPGDRDALTDGGPSDAAQDAAMDSGEPAPSRGFAPIDGLDPGGLARPIGDAFWIWGQTLLSGDGADGSSWLYWREYFDPTFAERAVHLDHFGADGVRLGSSDLEELPIDGVARQGDGTLTAYQNRCGPGETDLCFYRDPLTGEITERRWPASPRTVTVHHLDYAGDVVSTSSTESASRTLGSLIGGNNSGFFGLGRHGSYVVHRLAADAAPIWSTEILPAVLPPELPPDAPIEDILRAADIAHQFTTTPVPYDGGLLVAATAARGTLAALNASRSLALPLPDDPRCADVVVVHIPHDGLDPRYYTLPTAECELLPHLAVLGHHAVIASAVSTPKTPEPNDTRQIDIGLGILDLTTGDRVTRVIDFAEDDVVHAVAPCGSSHVCLAGTTGARSVDTGSTVTFGDGFLVAASLTGELDSLFRVTSPRHSEVHLAAPGGDGSVLFFATVNGPISHTADGDPALGYNEALFGKVPARILTSE